MTHLVSRTTTLFFAAFALAAMMLASSAHAAEDSFLTTNLSLGDEGAEVTLLQEWLSKDADLYPEQVVNGTFGPATERAVKRYQENTGFVSVDPSGVSMYGKVGPVTRATLNAEFSNRQGGIASVEGNYDSMLKFNGETFIPLQEKTYNLNTGIRASFNVWVDPSAPADHATVILENPSGYSIGFQDMGRIFAATPSGRAVTSEAPVIADTWQHISVLFTQTDAVFLYNNEVIEIVKIMPNEGPSFFERLFKGISGTFQTIFPPVSSVADNSEAEAGQAPAVESQRPGVVKQLVSFARGLFGLPPVAEPVVVEDVVEPPPVEVVSVPPVELVPAKPIPPKTAIVPIAPTIKIPPVLLLPTTTATSVPLLPVISTTSTTTASTTATTTVVVSTSTPAAKKAKSLSKGKTPKDSTPLISLEGSSRISVGPGSVYTDPGASAYDLEDGDLTSQIVVGGDTIDYDEPDTYRITYNVTDSSGKEAKEVVRSVTILGMPDLSEEEQEPRYDLAPAGQQVSYTVSSGEGADPAFISIDIDPLHVYVGDTQTFTVKVSSPSGVASVTTETELDSTTHRLDLVSEGTSGDVTTFSGSWVVYDTHVREYRTLFTATNNDGDDNSMTMAWSDPCAGVTQGSNSSLSADCTVTSVYGLDGGNVTIPTGRTLTINSGGTWAWNPGTTITVDGQIAKGSGGLIRKGYLFYVGASNAAANTATMVFDTASTLSGHVRVNQYTQASYYSQAYYEAYYESFYCFAPETQVLMANGTTKAIQDVRLGDVVMGQDTYGRQRPNVVTYIYRHGPEENGDQDYQMLKVNDISVRSEHLMFTTDGWMIAGDLAVGDVLVGASGMVPVTSIEEGSAEATVYNLTTYPNHTYYAGGVLVHNAKGEIP